MTREEAINVIKSECYVFSPLNFDRSTKINTALDMAIKALEKESRSAIVKNDLAVREFEEIVVEYPPEDLCTYPEYKGKPYFSIKYKEGNEHFIGYGTYKPEVFSRYLRDYFMPSIRPKGHWIDHSDEGYVECSNCGSATNCDGNIADLHFCFSCSAKMDE